MMGKSTLSETVRADNFSLLSSYVGNMIWNEMLLLSGLIATEEWAAARRVHCRNIEGWCNWLVYGANGEKMYGREIGSSQMEAYFSKNTHLLHPARNY